MILLYEHPLSPYAQKVKIALAEKGIPFTTRLPEAFGSGAVRDEAFKLDNPRHEVPVLVDGDFHVFDSTVILEYLEDKWPEPPLLPRDPAERARLRMLEDVMDTHYEAINWGLLEIDGFKRASGALREEMLARAARQCAALQAWLEGALGEREWFGGTRFGWGDAAVVPHLNTSAARGQAPPPGGRLADWLRRANERPSVAACVASVRATVAAMPDLGALIASGRFKRQYRDHRLEWMMRSGGLPIVLEGIGKGTIRFGNEIA
jgi:glutathione S-transferase